MKCNLSLPRLSDGIKAKKFLGVPIFGVTALLGGILVMLTLGSFYSFGNIMTYMTSYMRLQGSPNITYSDFIVVQSTFGITQGVTMPLIGYVTLLIGEKTSIMVGCLLYSLGCTLTYFTIQTELWLVALTYGFLSSVGQNMALIPSIITAIKWFPTHKGLASGAIVSGYGGGSFIFNQIQTQFINPENFKIESSGPNQGYFTNTILLDRLPTLLLLLGGIYFTISMIGGLLIFQPSEEWYAETHESIDDSGLKSWKDILRRKEFYLLWVTRFVIPLFTQVIGGFYKTFGLTFISDDHFLSIVGTINSVFNCTGRLFYGFLMDKISYKFAMCVNTIILMIFTSTFYCTSLVGAPIEGFSCRDAQANATSVFANNFTTYDNLTSLVAEPCDDGVPPETPVEAKILFALWVWAIFFTFPGIYAMQPAVCTQNFGQKYGGMAYSLLFTSDIFNNLLVAMSSKPLIQETGFLGLFLCTASFGILSVIATLFYPKHPSPRRKSASSGDEGE